MGLLVAEVTSRLPCEAICKRIAEMFKLYTQHISLSVFRGLAGSGVPPTTAPR